MAVGETEEPTARAGREAPAAAPEVGVLLQSSILPLLQSQSPFNLTKHDLSGLLKALTQL